MTGPGAPEGGARRLTVLRPAKQGPTDTLPLIGTALTGRECSCGTLHGQQQRPVRYGKASLWWLRARTDVLRAWGRIYLLLQ